MTESVGGYASATHDGFVVSSNTETSAEITKNLASEPAAPDDKPDPKKEAKARISEAASELGKKGGKAAAKVRAEAKEDVAKEDVADEADAGDGEDTGKRETLGHPRHDPKARMLEAVRKEAEARREKDALAARLAALEAEAAQLRQPKEQPREAPKAEAKPTETDRPKQSDFETYDEYVDALTDWKTDQKFQRYGEEQKQRAQIDEQANELRGHLERMAAAIKADPDVWAAIDPEIRAIEPATWRRLVGQPFGALEDLGGRIIAHPEGMRIAQYLTENRADFEAFKAMRDPISVAEAWAVVAHKATSQPKVEREEADTEPAPRPTSKAKPPVRSITSSPVVSDDDDNGDGLSDEAYLSKRMKQLRRK